MGLYDTRHIRSFPRGECESPEAVNSTSEPGCLANQTAVVILSVFNPGLFGRECLRPVMSALLPLEVDPVSVVPALRVQVAVTPLPESAEGESVFRVAFELENASSQELRLMSRCWRLIDADHQVSELRGPCVLGQRPKLVPGAAYSFSCELRLATAWGSLEGAIFAVDAEGRLHECSLERQILAVKNGVRA